MIIKNSNLRSFLYDERYKIFAIIIAIILILVVLRILNDNAKREIDESIKQAQNNPVTYENSYNPSSTVISRK